MKITINDDLSSILTTDDDALECRLPSYNPETLAPFASYEEVEAYARSIEGRPFFFQPKKPAEPIPAPPQVSPVEFKLLFTALERVAIKAARGNDPVIDDFFSIIEDPRLTHVNLGLQSTQDALAYLESKGLITAVRRQQILAGQVQ